jgi:hypothetical protein
MALEYFDIVVIIPLEEELSEFIELFPSLEDRSTATELRHIVDSGDPEVRISVAQQEEMGRNSANRSVSNLLDTYDAGLIVTRDRWKSVR